MQPKTENGNKKILTAANGVTMLRIIGTVGLLFLSPMTSLFLAVYTFTGITDALDGFIARRTGTASDLGAKLDSIADLLFYGVLMIKLIPVLWAILPWGEWCAAAFILSVRIASYLTAAKKYHCFASLHTYLNKLTGLAVFLLPYSLIISAGEIYGWVVCGLAFAASAEELAIHIISKEYKAERKSIFLK